MVGTMRSAAGLFYAAVFTFSNLATASSHGSTGLDTMNKCAVSRSRVVVEGQALGYAS